jgi:hypothetical protein
VRTVVVIRITQGATCIVSSKKTKRMSEIKSHQRVPEVARECEGRERQEEGSKLNRAGGSDGEA